MDTGGRVLLSPGEQVAGYEIEDYVARGGMAVVYRARDLSLGRRVALKVIAPEFAGNETFRQRFIRESELAASIDHPNIVPIYQAGDADGLLYIAMRYVEGDDLRGILAKRGRLDPELALPLFTQVAAALDTAHAHGLVHRDVKPGNILIAASPGGIGESHVYLTDFGLTKRSSSLSGFTTAGHFIGTIAYVAPEQIAGRTVTQAADVYAMGCVLYETLAGVPPFERDHDVALLWAHMSTAPPPISQLRPDLPAGVDEVLARALAKDPVDRTPSCRAVVAELREAFRSAAVPSDSADSVAPVPVLSEPPGLPGEKASDRSDRVRRRWWIVPAVCAVLLLVAASFVVIPRIVRSEYLPYAGSASSSPWLAFDRPRQWTIHPNLTKTCFCTDQYGAVLETGDWRGVIAAMNRGESVEGLYAEQTPGALDLDDSAAVSEVLSAFLSKNKKQLGAPVLTSVGGRSAWQIDGTLIASKDATLRLKFRYLLLHNSAGTKTNNLVLFARDTDFDALSSRLDHVAASIRWRVDG